jgi:hypothetical protein
MLATLVANSLVTASDVNKRIRDIIKLYCGEITTVAGLDATVWDTSICTVTATNPGNFSRIYASVDFDNLGSTVSWHVYLKKTSAVVGKDVTFKITKDSATVFGVWSGKFLADGSSSSVSSAVAYFSNTMTTAGNKLIVGTGSSGLFCSSSYGIGFGIERTNYPYDKNSTEGLGITGSIASSPGVIYVPNIFNPKLQNYVAYAPNLKIADSGDISITRDVNGQVALPFIPMYIESYENGWAGGNLSINSGLWRTADSYGKTGDSVIKDSKTYRVLQVAATTLRYLALDE